MIRLIIKTILKTAGVTLLCCGIFVLVSLRITFRQEDIISLVVDNLDLMMFDFSCIVIGIVLLMLNSIIETKKK